jgi:hypothetical protein
MPANRDASHSFSCRRRAYGRLRYDKRRRFHGSRLSRASSVFIRCEFVFSFGTSAAAARTASARCRRRRRGLAIQLRVYLDTIAADDGPIPAREQLTARKIDFGPAARLDGIFKKGRGLQKEKGSPVTGRPSPNLAIENRSFRPQNDQPGQTERPVHAPNV